LSLARIVPSAPGRSNRCRIEGHGKDMGPFQIRRSESTMAEAQRPNLGTDRTDRSPRGRRIPVPLETTRRRVGGRCWTGCDARLEPAGREPQPGYRFPSFPLRQVAQAVVSDIEPDQSRNPAVTTSSCMRESATMRDGVRARSRVLGFRPATVGCSVLRAGPDPLPGGR
jgi:hypothetical protein